MDDTVRLPISILVSAFTGVGGFVAAWVKFGGRLASLEKKTDRLEAILDSQAKTLGDARQEVHDAARRISDIAELKDTTVRGDVFKIRMDAQDDALNELRIAMERKVSISTMAAATGGDPSGLPPPRPRAPSRPR